MKDTLDLVAILVFSVLFLPLQAQLHLLPQAGLAEPLGAYAETNSFADRGPQLGLHIDQLWRVLGIGLYGGNATHQVDQPLSLPIQVNTDLLQYQTFNQSEEAFARWQSVQVALGPILRLPLGRKSDLQFFAKGGVALLEYPDYRDVLLVTEPVEREYTLFATQNNEWDNSIHPLLLSGFRFNLGLSERIALSLGGQFTHIRDVTHSYTYLDHGLGPNATDAEIIEIFSKAPTVTETRECHFNSIGLTVGITFRLGSRPQPKPDPIAEGPTPLPDPPSPPPTPTGPDYQCDQLTILGPGFNDVYTLKEKNQVDFSWSDASGGFPGLQYELVLYAQNATGYVPIHREVTSGTSLSLNLRNINGMANDELYWEVNPLLSGTDPCPYSSTKMRVHVFHNRKAAEDALPGCKL